MTATPSDDHILTVITSWRNISFARSLAAFMAAVMLPPARPAAYARSIHGYLTRSGSLKVSLAVKKRTTRRVFVPRNVSSMPIGEHPAHQFIAGQTVFCQKESTSIKKLSSNNKKQLCANTISVARDSIPTTKRETPKDGRECKTSLSKVTLDSLITKKTGTGGRWNSTRTF